MIDTSSIYDNFKLFGKELCGKECQARKNKNLDLKQQQTANQAIASEQQSKMVSQMFAPTSGGGHTTLYVGIGVAVFIVIAIVVMFIYLKKKRGK
jgi:hypothetical protein